MAFEKIVTSLKTTPLFQNLQLSQIKDVAQLAEKVLFKPGDIIIEEGTAGHCAILLVSGTAVRVSGPHTRPRGEEIAEGSMIAEMAMLVETEHSSTVIARTPVKALRINRSDLAEHMLEDRDLAEHLVHVLAQRLTALAAELRAIEGAISLPSASSTPLHAQHRAIGLPHRNGPTSSVHAPAHN